MRRMKRESGGLCRSAMEQGSLFILRFWRKMERS